MSETTDINAIDAAINAAKAAKAAKATIDTGSTKKSKRRKLTPAERAKQLEDYEMAKRARAAARSIKKAQKEAERAAARAANPPHMAKVNKAAEALPKMSSDAQEFFDSLTGALTPADVFILSENLSHWVRAERTKASADMNLNVGDRVRIKSGSPKHVGAEGLVTKAQRIRCFVDVGEKKPVYLFNADVEVLEAAKIEAVPEDSEEHSEEPTAIAS